MDEQLIALYHRHVAAAFDRKLRLADFIHEKAGKVKWKYEVATATLACGPKLKIEAPLLGTHVHSNDSWLWAWSNRNLKLTLTNRALGDLVRVTAHRIGIPMFAHAGFSLEPLLGSELIKHAAEVIGGILARELAYDAYHIASEDSYDSAILIRHDKLKFTERYPLHRVQTVFPQVIDELPVFDHRAALTAYAHDYGLNVTADHGTRKITDGKGGELTATFDDHDRLTDLSGTGIAIPPVKKVKKVTKVVKAAKAAKKPTKKAPVKKVAAKVTAKPAATKPAKKPPAKKAAMKKVVVKKVVVKKAPAKKPSKKR
jgi:hypothetical protein